MSEESENSAKINLENLEVEDCSNFVHGKYNFSFEVDGEQYDGFIKLAPIESRRPDIIECNQGWSIEIEKELINQIYPKIFQLEKEKKAKVNSSPNKAWDFVEEHYPNYEISDEIAKADDIQKIIDNEDEEGSCARNLRVELESNHINFLDYWKQVHCNVYEKAILAFIQKQS